MHDAVIVAALRTPIGKRGGALREVHPVELLGGLLVTLIERTGIDPAQVDDVIIGCVDQVGEQAANIARNAWLAAGLPESVPATTIDRQCGSSLQAIHFAAQGVIAGAYDLVIAGGVESMTRVPMLCTVQHGPGTPLSEGLRRRYGLEHGWFDQALAAELVARRWALNRAALDAYGLESHRRAAAAQRDGRFADEIVPVRLADGRCFSADEGVRHDTSPEKMAALPPAFAHLELITAGNASQISDGASAVLIASAARARALGLRPRARFVSFALAGVDPVTMLTGPIPATQRALQRAGLPLEAIDLCEVNEAFAAVVLAWQRALGANPERVNVNGGAIALGHPLGASGARIMTTLLHELERRGGRYGLATICEGGGMANATIIERIAADA